MAVTVYLVKNVRAVRKTDQGLENRRLLETTVRFLFQEFFKQAGSAAWLLDLRSFYVESTVGAVLDLAARNLASHNLV